MKLFLIPFLLFILTVSADYTLKRYDNDPLKVWHYTLDNGLEVYLTENHDKPVFYSEIVVRAGSTSDPATSTGIAHYLEHMLFKGTDRFGTADFQKEKPLLDKITALYEDYRKTSDDEGRKEIMKEISKLSAKAATYAIPNEFDRMYQQLGGTKINAHTSSEETVYKVQCPSTSFKQWCLIESERFRKPVFRLFQTEIEAVYEEKNGSLDSKDRALYYKFLENMYKNHPYGQQTTLGSVEHLKSPSIKDMYEFYETYYVPNNMAIVISGDVNPPEAIKLIDRYFSHWQRKELPKQKTWSEDALKGEELINIDFPGQEQMMMGFRTVPVGHKDENALKMLDMILDNSQAGLINVNINQKLKAQKVGSYPMMMNDYGSQNFYGIPKKGQSLEDVKKLILEQIAKVKNGEFQEWLLPAIVADFTKNQFQKIESNAGRVTVLRDLFINRQGIDSYSSELSKIAKVKKGDVVKVANKYFGENRLVVNRHDKAIEKVKMEKPDFKPIEVDTNRKSAFANRVAAMPKKKQAIQFVDFSKDVEIKKISDGVTLYRVENPVNGIFNFKLTFPVGQWHEPKLSILADLINNGSFKGKSVAEFKRELYKLAGEYSFAVGRNQSTLSVSGLDINLAATLELIFKLTAGFETTKERIDEQAGILLNQQAKGLKDPSNLSYMLAYYARYKEKSPFKNRLTKEDYEKLTPEELSKLLQSTLSHELKVQYTGTKSTNEVEALLKPITNVEERKSAPSEVILEFPEVTENTVYFYNFDSVQTKVRMEFPGDMYAVDQEAIYDIFNEYFDGSLGSIVFQEMREKRALAYSAWARYFPIGRLNEQNLFIAGISTQADKTLDAIKEFQKIIQNVPFDEQRFAIAKSALVSQVESNRVNFRSIASTVAKWQRLGLSEDPNQANLTKFKSYSLSDIESFVSEKLKGRKLIFTLVGDKKRLDLSKLEKFGKVIEVTAEEISK
ncbi:MAG: insulinase family protein [Lentisphaeraceae bacterium]|nr:insulinase family protein [Lentisphaeraceae bacterium]